MSRSRRRFLASVSSLAFTAVTLTAQAVVPAMADATNGADGTAGSVLDKESARNVTVNSVLTGGNGGDGGPPSPSPFPSYGGNGGNGGAGLEIRESYIKTLTIGSAARLTGGNGGAGAAGTKGGETGSNGQGGYGFHVSGADDVAIDQMIVEGTITGGLGGDGVTRAEAIYMENSSNTLVLRSGASLVGNVYLGTSDGTLQLEGTGTEDADFDGLNSLVAVSGASWSLSGDVKSRSGGLSVNTAGTGALTLSGTLDTSRLTKTGTGTLSVTGTNSFSGGITVNQGELSGTAGSLGGDISNAGKVTFVQSANATFAHDFSGSGQLVKDGAGTLVLRGNNTHTGQTTVLAGTLRAGSSTAFAENTDYVLGGGTLDLNDHDLTVSSMTGSGNVDLGSAALTVNTIGSDTLGAFISGSGSLTKAGTGSLTLTGVNTFSGGISVTWGDLVGSTTSLTGNIANSGTVTFAQSTNDFFAGDISGSGNLKKTGSGTLILSGNNIYAGTTTVSVGILQAGGFTGFAQNAPYVVGSGATLDLNDFDLTVTSLTGAGSVDLGAADLTVNTSGSDTFSGIVLGTGSLTKSGSGTLTLTGTNIFSGDITVSGGALVGTTQSLSGNIANAGTVTFDQSAGGTFAYDISGSGHLVKDGAGTLTLAGTSGYTGTTTVLSGTLLAGSAGAFAQNSAYVVGGGLLDLNGHDLTVSSLTGAGNVDLGTADLTFDGAGSDTFSGVISGSGSLVKTGNGTLILGGDNLFTGNTAVNAGKLVVNGSTGAVTLASGATLGGNGTVGSITASGTIAPGNSAGTLTSTGNVSFLEGAAYEVEIDTKGDSDKLVAAGTVSIASSGTVLDVQSVVGDYPFQERYTVISASGGVSGTFETIQDNLPDLDLKAEYSANEVALFYDRDDEEFTTKEVFASGTVAAVNGAIDFSRILRQRGLTGSLFTQRGTAGSALEDLALGYVSARKAAAEATGKALTGAPGYDWTSWGMAAGSLTSVGASGNKEGWDARLAGLNAGFERKFEAGSVKGVVGFAGGISQGDLANGGAGADLKNGFGGIYSGLTSGSLSVALATTVGWQQYDYDRDLLLGVSRGKADGYSLTGSASAFYDVLDGASLSGLRFGPYGSVDAGYAYHYGFSETGAGVLNLKVEDMAVRQTDTGLGIRFGIDREVGKAIVKLDGNVGWQHLFGDTSVGTDSSITFVDARFTTSSVPLDRDRLAVGLGAAMQFDDRLTTHVRYDGGLSPSSQSHSASAGLSWLF